MRLLQGKDATDVVGKVGGIGAVVVMAMASCSVFLFVRHTN
jgi:hypothetical protein